MNEAGLGALAAFGSSVTWAIGASLYARLSLHYSASAINVSRAAVALLAFLIWVLVREGSLAAAMTAIASVEGSRLTWLALSIFASYAFGDVLFFWSTRVLGIASAMAIASTYPVWAALTGAVTKGEWLNFYQTAGLVTVVFGTILVIWAAPRRAVGEAAHDEGAPRFVSTKRAGVLLAFATSLCWTLNTWTVAKAGDGLHASVGNVYRMGFAILLCPLIGAFMRGASKDWWLRKEDFRKSLPIFFLEGFGGTIFFYYGMTHTSLAVGATLSSLSPVLAYGVGLLLRWESFDLRRFAGILLVVVGLAALLGLG